MEQDFKLLGEVFMNLVDGGDDIGVGIKLLQKHGLVDEDGYWIYED